MFNPYKYPKLTITNAYTKTYSCGPKHLFVLCFHKQKEMVKEGFLNGVPILVKTEFWIASVHVQHKPTGQWIKFRKQLFSGIGH